MRFALLTRVAIVLLAQPGTLCAEETVITVFDSARIELDRDLAEGTRRGGYIVRSHGRTVETTLRLPAPPPDQRNARRIVATVTVKPLLTELDGLPRPSDPWTRLGSLSVLVPTDEPQQISEVELMRFTTGFGGRGTFSQDVTPLAPLLHGAKTFRLAISTYQKPGWEVSLTLTYSSEGAGHRRPEFALALFNHPLVTAEQPRLRASVRIPGGLAMPRLRIISTGHATDGMGGDEFVSRTHVLRIDGREIIRWRPWSESGGALRRLNPTSGRKQIDGRELWSSDLDRSGWHPGTVVEPLVVPAPELTAGRHEIELQILNIRPKEEGSSAHGYWRLSAVIVADEPWPETNPSDENTPNE